MAPGTMSIFQQNYNLTNEGITIEFRTTERVLPSHWHDDMEIIYLLNGSTTLLMEGKVHSLGTGSFIVVDAGMIHEVKFDSNYMQVVIRIREALVQSLLGRSRDFRILCSREDLTLETMPDYEEICGLLRQLVPLYIKQPRGYMIKSQSLILDVLFRLMENFSVSIPFSENAAGAVEVDFSRNAVNSTQKEQEAVVRKSGSPAQRAEDSTQERTASGASGRKDATSGQADSQKGVTSGQREAAASVQRTLSHPVKQRTQAIAHYIDEHYAEPLTLDGIADHFGLNPEYFSRMFRRYFGTPFTHHLHHVRLVHIYHDICTTDEPVMEVAERHGFTNYKLFGKLFKEYYGKTPREVRRDTQ